MIEFGKQLIPGAALPSGHYLDVNCSRDVADEHLLVWSELHKQVLPSRARDHLVSIATSFELKAQASIAHRTMCDTKITSRTIIGKE